jgi:hypothetical protein
MAPKVLPLVSSCKECPKYSYYSGGQSVCLLTNEFVTDASKVASFCPLPDYPSRTIASLDAHIAGLEKGMAASFRQYLLTYIVSKTGATIGRGERSVTLKFHDHGNDREVVVGLSEIRSISVDGVIDFVDGQNMPWALHMNATPPLLRESRDKEGESWYHHHLQVT